jgi:hypothetical protein
MEGAAEWLSILTIRKSMLQAIATSMQRLGAWVYL